MNARRLEAVRQKTRTLRLDALLVTFIPHVRYLSDFSGSNGLIFISPRKKVFITDGRYRNQSAREVKGFSRLIAGRSLFTELCDQVRPPAGSRIGIDRQHVSALELHNLQRLFPGARFVGAEGLVEEVSSVKERSEVAMIRKAISISERVFKKVLGIIRSGISELDVAAEIAYLHLKFGAEAEAFEPIVASGKRGSFPHARATAKKIRAGELVTLDFGCRYRGYHSDITRTLAIGRIGAEQRRLYGVVHDAQRYALDAARAGMRGKNLDGIARGHITRHGLGKFFTHSLGHGLGLQVHEKPRISFLSNDLLLAGNVITIEPGVYVPGVGGVRIEDDIVLKQSGNEVLTKLPRGLIQL